MAGKFADRRTKAGRGGACGGLRVNCRSNGLLTALLVFLNVFLISAGALTAASPGAAAPIPAHDDPAWVPVGPGVHYTVVAWSGEDAAQTVHVLRIQRGQRHVRLAASLGRGQVEGTEAVLTQALRMNAEGLSGGGALLADASGRAPLRFDLAPAAVVGGVNADFFASSPTPGLPVGLHVQGGEIVVGPAGRPVFAVLRDGRPVIGVPQLAGEVWREQPPDDAAGAPGGFADDLLVRAAITDVNRPPNGIGLVIYTPRFGTETPPLQGTVVTLRGVAGPLESGRVYSGVVARKNEGRAGEPVRAVIPADGIVLAGRGAAEVLLEDLAPGEWVQFRVELLPPFDQAVEAVAGWPVLVDDGAILPLNGGGDLVVGRHPRTAVGFNDEHLFFVAADGRQRGYADGMTLPELAEFMAALGATEAVNLDGGGSTTMVLRPPGEELLAVVNRPSDGHERVVANALFVLSTAPSGPPATLHVRPAAPAVLAGAALPLRLLGQDVNHNPVPVDPTQVTWSAPGAEVLPATADVSEVLTQAPGGAAVGSAGLAGSDASANSTAFALRAFESGNVTVTARIGAVSAAIPVDVVTQEEIVGIELTPDVVHLADGESAALTVRGYDAVGRRVWVEPGQVTWAVNGARCFPVGADGVDGADGLHNAGGVHDTDGVRDTDGTYGADGTGPGDGAEAAGTVRRAAGDDVTGGQPCDPGTIVTVDDSGVVTATRPGEAVVEARLGSTAATAFVTVNRPPVLLSDFETSGEWYATSVRARAALSFVGPPDHVRSGDQAAKLVYDLSVSPGGTAAAYVTAATPIPIPDRPRAVGVWVYGDASGHWLRANYIDGDGNRQVMDLTPVGGLNWVGWRFVQGEIPADAVLPLSFERVYVVEMHRERQSRGVLYFDDLVALYGQP